VSRADIFPGTSIDIRITPYDWPFLRECRREIDDFWRHFCARKSQAYDGRVLLLHAQVWRDGHLDGQAFETDYSAFMAWKSLGYPGDDICNFFGMAALRSSDGAFLLGEMNSWTAHAGQSYFPAGTPEPADCSNGVVDLESSVLRECAEETGLLVHEIDNRGSWIAVRRNGQLALMRDILIRFPADEARALIEARIARQDPQELARIHIVRRPEDGHALTMPDYMQPFLDFSFG
jgi:8-oxo-dGTP pyrophosphatase MutT (NUDIX family)